MNELRETEAPHRRHDATALPGRKRHPLHLFADHAMAARLWCVVAVTAVGFCAVQPFLVIRAYRTRERVIVLDPSGTFHVSPLLGFEEATKLHEQHALLACLALFQRNPAGFDYPELLDKLFLPDAARKAQTRTSTRVFERIMEAGPDGRFRLREAPPVLQHVQVKDEAKLTESFREYLTSVPSDIAVVLSHFQLTDIARRVVGVGSVGTRSYLLILTGPDGTPLILQVKEANRSVLEEYGGRQQPESLRAPIAALGQGIRVVGGQRILQAMSDVFLGTLRIGGRDYYVRQFQDMKGSVETAGLDPDSFGEYAGACAYALARGHAQSANASLLRGYVGGGDAVGEAVVEWSYAYADKTLADFGKLKAAAKSGAIQVAPDPLR